MKKKIALLLICAMVSTNICACSSAQLSETITDLGVNLYQAYQNRDEIESEVSESVTDRITEIAANIGSNLSKAEEKANPLAKDDSEKPTREEDIINALESAGSTNETEGVISAPETEVETRVSQAETSAETKAVKKDTQSETKAEKVDHTLSDALKKLFEENDGLEDLVRDSLKSAKKVNSDKKTNPVQSLTELYTFVDESYENPQINYFYFLFDQELEELKKDTNSHPYLEYHEPITSWMDDCTSAWTKHEQVTVEPMVIDCEDDKAYAPADMTIVEVEKSKANGEGATTVSAKLDGKNVTLLSPVCGKVRIEKPTGTPLALSKWDDEKKQYVSENPLPTRIVVEVEDYGDVVIAPYDFTNRYKFEINDGIKDGKTVDHGDVLGKFIYGGEYVIMGFESNEEFEIVAKKDANDEYEPLKAGDLFAYLGVPKQDVSKLLGEAVAEVETEAETKAISKAKTKAETKAETEEETETLEETKAEPKKEEIILSDDATGFVMVTDVAPNIIQDMRYFSLYNELEERLPGYEQPALLLTKEAAEKIKVVSESLLKQGYILKIYDAYRPKEAQDTLCKKLGAEELSDNTRGSAVDVTLVDKKTGKELDMSNVRYGFTYNEDATLTDEQLGNQMLLKIAMLSAGFKASNDWYHFVLDDEPYKNTYFTFPIRFDVAGKTKAQREAEKVEEQILGEKKRKIRYVIEVYDDGTIEVKEQGTE